MPVPSAVVNYYHGIKELNIYTVLTLGLVAVLTLVPIHIPTSLKIASYGIVFALLSYVLYQTFQLTNNVRKQTPSLFVDDKQVDLRNNVVLSYLFVLSLVCLLFYLLFTKVF